MAFLPARPPPAVLGVALAAFVLAGYDIVYTILAMMRPEGTGAVIGTFLRDGLLMVGGVMVLRRAAWAAWMTGALFAFTLLRLLAADEWLTFAVSWLAVLGIALLLLPDTRAWLRADVAGAMPLVIETPR